MGSAIINAIQSAFALIGSLASNFVTGFSTLVWDSTGNTLTTVGLFSCIFLGVAITFAMIRLAMNLLGKNTGVK